MRKFTSIFVAVVLCLAAFAVVVSADITDCEEGNHDWSAWRTVKCENGTFYQERTCACEATETQEIHQCEYVNVKAVAATCETDGNVAYKYCKYCNSMFDAEGNATTAEAVVIPAGHKLVEVEAKAATCEEDGNVAYSYCTECDYVSVENTVIPAAHKLVHVEAKAATCEENGNIEYWYCENCDWVEVAGGMASNPLAVQTPAAHKLVQVDAKAATCYENGNILYWYCENCDWVEVEGGLASNLLAVQLPVVHNLEHVAAKEPTATENGNVEYWYCKDCGFAWLDEYLIFNTNLKSVILPATGEVTEPESPSTGDNAIYFFVALVAVATVGIAVVSFKKREN